MPQVTGMAEPWASEVKSALSGRTEELERLVVERYARGLSMHNIEAVFTAPLRDGQTHPRTAILNEFKRFVARHPHKHGRQAPEDMDEDLGRMCTLLALRCRFSLDPMEEGPPMG